MAQTGYTPILIYSSSTTTNAPAVANLTNSTLGSELAINITDGKLFYKDNANAIQVIAWKTTPTSAGGTGLTSYTAGDLLYYATGTTLSKLAIGASGRWLGSSGSAPQWNAPAALTKTDDTNVTLTLGGSASTALLNAASLTLGWTGTLAVSRGGTGTGTALTTGSVVFAGASGVYSQDNANFYWDDTNNRLGIGTATPAGPVDITNGGTQQYLSNGTTTGTATGTVYSTLAMRSLKGGGAGAFAYDDAWIQTQRANLSYSGDAFTHDSKLVFFTNTSNRDGNPVERMSLDSSGLTIPSGNLSVSGAVSSISGSLTVASGATATLFTPASATGYLVTVAPSSGDSNSSGACFVISRFGTSLPVLATIGVAGLAFSASAGALQITNATAFSYTYDWTAVKLIH